MVWCLLPSSTQATKNNTGWPPMTSSDQVKRMLRDGWWQVTVRADRLPRNFRELCGTQHSLTYFLICRQLVHPRSFICHYLVMHMPWKHTRENVLSKEKQISTQVANYHNHIRSSFIAHAVETHFCLTTSTWLTGRLVTCRSNDVLPITWQIIKLEFS